MDGNGAEALRELVQELGLSNGDVARISGKSTGTVSQALSGKYRGRAEAISEIMEALAAHRKEREERREAAAAAWQTEGQGLIASVLGLTWATRGFSVVVGPSGIGKTHTALRFAEWRPDALYMRCSDGMCMGDVIDALLGLTGTPSHGSNSQRLRRAIRALADHGARMVLVDEADLLVTDGSRPKILKKISVFREVKEAGIGVSLIGLESFDTALRAVGETYVTSRIDMLRRAVAPTMPELERYMSGLGIDTETEGARRALALAPKNGSMRFVGKAADIARQLGGDMLEALRVLFAASPHVKGA